MINVGLNERNCGDTLFGKRAANLFLRWDCGFLKEY
jgi:hypothetical protein